MPEAAPVTVMRCAACGALDPGPRELCPNCHGPLGRHAVPGTGEIVSWTLIRRPPSRFKEDGQYAVAIVRLDAGVQVTGRLEGASEEIKPGARVAASGALRDTTVFVAV